MTQPRKIAHVHRDVAEVAKEAAGELYELVMSENRVYALWRAQHPGMGDKALRRAFVERNWGRCIPMARATMARLLAQPTIDPETKERIMEALELDASLIKGRADPKLQLA